MKKILKIYNIRAIHFSKIGLFLLAVFLVFSGAICSSDSDLVPPERVILEYWRFEDNSGSLDAAITSYSAMYPHVSIRVSIFKPEEYEDALFNAWSKGEGPDIFSVPNWRIGKFREFIKPMIKEPLNLKTSHIEKKLGKQNIIVEQNTELLPSVEQLQNIFVATVSKDVVYNQEIFGLPLSFDTLGMYYNRSLLARSQIALPPTTWEEFISAVSVMVSLDDQLNIIRSAAALGTSDNIPHFFDIISLIMLQTGTEVATDRGDIVFASVDENGNMPGAQALSFYSTFSNPVKQTYTWDEEQLSALETFTQGDLGFYFGYYSDLEKIEQRAPHLDFSYTKIPQLDINNSVNYANYTVETVHVKSESPEHAWNFINHATTQKNIVNSFLENTGRVPAIMTLIGEKQDDNQIGVFTSQALTAKTWYHGVDPDSALEVFKEMVDSANLRTGTLESIITLAASKINLTYVK